MNIDIPLRGQLLNVVIKENSSARKRVLWIEPTARLKEAQQYVHHGICFHHIPLIEEASLLIKDAKFKLDAVVISPEHSRPDILNIKEGAVRRSIPLIMYTSVFSQRARHLTLQLGVDEYHSGVIGEPFLKRIEFLKKVKEYKNHQSHRPGMVMVLKAMPKIGKWAMKRTFDLMGSFIALLILLPLIALIAAIIKMSSKGPVYITCKRVGLGYNIFDLYKFRTKPGDTSDASENHIGKFLEVSGLNELPALINVLKGDMSFIGSRPLLMSEAEKLTKDQIAIRLMTPVGITGHWRIKKMKTAAESYDTDINYAMANSFWGDVRILFLTFIALPLEQKL